MKHNVHLIMNHEYLLTRHLIPHYVFTSGFFLRAWQKGRTINVNNYLNEKFGFGCNFNPIEDAAR